MGRWPRKATHESALSVPPKKTMFEQDSRIVDAIVTQAENIFFFQNEKGNKGICGSDARFSSDSPNAPLVCRMRMDQGGKNCPGVCQQSKWHHFFFIQRPVLCRHAESRNFFSQVEHLAFGGAHIDRLSKRRESLLAIGEKKKKSQQRVSKS